MSNELNKALKNDKTEEEKMAVFEKFTDKLKKISEEEIEEITGGIGAFASAKNVPKKKYYT